MAYTPTTWVGGVTKLGPTNLNHLEGGVQAAAAVADAAKTEADAALPTPGGVDGQFLQRVSGVWVPHTLVAADMPSSIPYAKLSLAGSIVSGDITDGTLVDADINGSAAIKGSKLATGLLGPPGSEVDYAQITTDATSAATTEGTAGTIVTGGAVTYDGATAVIVEFYSPAVTTSVSNTGVFFILYDGSSSIGIFGEKVIITGGFQDAAYFRRKITPSAAAHTYSVRAYNGSGTITVKAGAGNGTGAWFPAYLRITKA